MRQHNDELRELEVAVAVVTFESAGIARAYATESAMDWPVLVDDSRSLYQGYEMTRGRWWQIYSPATIWAYVRLLLGGRKLARSSGDIHQMGGDVLIDPDGIVRLHHVSRDPADRPDVSQILERVRAGG